MGKELSLLLALAFGACASTFAAENRTKRGDELDDSINTRLLEEGASERVDRFLVLKEKLKSAVCDETFISKAPSLESLTSRDSGSSAGPLLLLSASDKMGEGELISFLLGDSLAGFYSEHVREQVEAALRGRGLESAPAARAALSGERFLEAQSIVMAVKRRTSLDFCEAMVNSKRLQQLLNAKPQRFLEAQAGDVSKSDRARFQLEISDYEGRFGQVADRLSAKNKMLIPGWVESFEVSRLLVLAQGGKLQRIYRRIANPITNNTQSIELANREGVPLGVLYLSREASSTDWAQYRAWAELPEARQKQIETYRSRIEAEAVRAVQRARSESHENIKNLQEFYKNLLQAYQLFPNEKQFETYSAGKAPRVSLDEVTRQLLGAEFLAALRQARVNGSSVHVGLFKPDPKLHAIYLEFSERLSKFVR